MATDRTGMRVSQAAGSKGHTASHTPDAADPGPSASTPESKR